MGHAAPPTLDRIENMAPIRFRLSALLVLVAVFAVALTIWKVTRPPTRTIAYLQFRSSILNQTQTTFTPRPTLKQIELARVAELALLKSDAFLSGVLADPDVATSANAASRRDSVAWLQERLRASFPNDGEILELRFEGLTGTPASDVAIMTAIIDAYVADVEKRAVDEAGAVPSVTMIQKPYSSEPAGR